MNFSTIAKKYALPLFVIAIISRSIEELSFIYYTTPLFLLLFLFLALKDVKINSFRLGSSINWSEEEQKNNTSNDLIILLVLMLVTTIWFIATSLWADYPMVSLERGFYFGLLATGCIAAGYLWTKESNKSLFDYLLPANIIIISLSLFSLITNIPGDSWTGGHGKGFMGFFGHQNQLGSLIIFTIPSVFSKLWRPVNSDQSLVISGVNTQNATNYLLLTSYFLLLISNLLVLILTYSRASWLSLAAGVIIFLIIIKSWKILFITFSLLTFIFILILSFPAINKTFNKILLKDFNTILESRIILWEPSLKAAEIGGLAGLGFGISEPDIILPGTGSHYEGERYVREKGNSTLAIIEESGFIGLILFMLPIGYIITKINKLRTEPRTLNLEQVSLRNNNFISNAIFIASIFTFLIHSQFEAWMVGVGSVQLPLFFISLGLFVQCSKSEVLG